MKGLFKKKSLEQALSLALLKSREHRNITCYVLDKHGKRAECFISELCLNRRLSEGYSIAYKAKNGLLIK